MEGTNYKATPLWLVYIGRILILTGMVLVFMGVSAIVSYYLCKILYGVDLRQVDYANLTVTDTQVISAMKLFQSLSGGIGMFLIPALLFPRVIGYSIETMINYQRIPKPWMFLGAILMVFVSVPLITWFLQVNQAMKFPAAWSDIEQSIRQMETQAEQLYKVFVAASSAQTLIVNLFVIALIPAICEEFFFRGVLLQYTRYIFDNTWVAIIVSAIVFSGFHGQFYGFVPRFALGVLLGYLFMNTANIWVPVTTHFLNNAMAVLLAYYEKDLSVFAIFNDKYEFPWYVVVLSLAATAGLCWWVQRTFIRSLYTSFRKKK